jgi:hypothetical protein
MPCLGQRISQRYLMSSTSQLSKEPLTLGTMFKSDSGQTYKIEEVLADRRKPLLSVYRARCVDLEVHVIFLLTAPGAAAREGITL